jgi:hypothetical protein
MIQCFFQPLAHYKKSVEIETSDKNNKNPVVIQVKDTLFSNNLTIF